jgi:lipoprotein-anchoring transpeptidase ErfK/SrfK
MIFINTSEQQLYFLEENTVKYNFKISTASKGLGCKLNSNKTPIGLHTVISKIGDGLPTGTLFKNRISTNKLINENPNDNKDYITSRIIWIGGLEEGINKGGDVDTFKRFIYIHGTPHVDKLGYPESHGCIRMSDNDVISLFNLINYKTLVLIY